MSAVDFLQGCGEQVDDTTVAGIQLSAVYSVSASNPSCASSSLDFTFDTGLLPKQTSPSCINDIVPADDTYCSWREQCCGHRLRVSARKIALPWSSENACGCSDSGDAAITFQNSTTGDPDACIFILQISYSGGALVGCVPCGLTNGIFGLTSSPPPFIYQWISDPIDWRDVIGIHSFSESVSGTSGSCSYSANLDLTITISG